MANFRRGAEAITQAMESGNRTGPRFVNNLMLTEDEKIYVQFLTPMSEAITALYHGWTITGITKTGKPQYNHFISRKDPAFDGVEGYDPIWDRFHYKPALRTFTVIAELEPEFVEKGGRKTVESVSLKTRSWTDREENEHVDPVFSVAAQAQSNFYGYLVSWEDNEGVSITDRVWSLVKRGKGKDVRYDFFPLSERVKPVDLSDVPEDSIINLEEYLSGLASRERLAELIDPLPDDWRISNNPPNDGRVTPKATSPVPAANDEDPPFEPDVKSGARKSGFAKLAEKVAAGDD